LTDHLVDKAILYILVQHNLVQLA